VADQVKHPDHYKAYCVGNEIKYRLRAGLKDGNGAEQDIKKALQYYKFRTDGG